MPSFSVVNVFFVAASVFLSAVLLSCEDYPRNQSHATVPLENIRKGKALAATHCGSCHQAPDPSLLDAKTWEKGVLPQMGPRLGIFEHNFRTYPSYRGDQNLPRDFYPSKSLLTGEEWQYVIDYYTATSPDSLEGQKRDHKIVSTLPLFSPQASSLSYPEAATSFLKIAPHPLPYALAISDVNRQTTFFLDKNLDAVDSIKNSGPVVDMGFSAESILACNIGRLHPNNGRFGKADLFSLPDGQLKKTPVTLFDSLQRPVQLSSADLNGDGQMDYVVCEFGFLTGALSWVEGGANGKFTRHVLNPLPGAVKAYISDWNGDKLPDICVLFAQGDERILLYLNKGRGQFEPQRLIQFPPVFGSSYFELADFNRDGHSDIVYTCGDNADYSLVLKPYHGVYIYLNDGKNNFRQQYFFPINGCYKATAQDFDNDGDLDLATISFFADYTTQPEEGFVYLENRGSFKFQPFTLPEAKKGRWLTMDAGDMDGDGRIDLVLGNFHLGPNLRKPQEAWSRTLPFLFLKNTGQKPKESLYEVR